MGFFSGLFGRTRAIPAAAPGPLADLLAFPPHPGDMPLEEVQFLAIDLETTGLDPARDEVLSVGFVTVRDGHVRLGTSALHRIRPTGQVGDSAVFHGLTDDELAHAPPAEEVLPQVLQALLPDPHQEESAYPKILLAHYASIEVDFLSALCERHYGAPLRIGVADTMELQRQLAGSGGYAPTRSGGVRLDECRQHYGLPRYRAHCALTDAIACAELFLAQVAHLSQRRDRALVVGDVRSAKRRIW